MIGMSTGGAEATLGSVGTAVGNVDAVANRAGVVAGVAEAAWNLVGMAAGAVEATLGPAGVIVGVVEVALGVAVLSWLAGVKQNSSEAKPLSCEHLVGVRRFELLTSSVSGKRSPPELNAQMERTTGLEPATPTLARLCSTN